MIWTALKEFINEYVLVRYNPDKHVLPPRQTRRRTSGQTEQANLAGHSLVRGQWWKPDMEDKSETATAAWRQEHVRTGGQRQEALTMEDKEMILDKGLKVEKAMLLKPYWAKGFTIPETSSLLSKSGGKRVRGYATRTVAEYFSAFSSTTDRGEAS